jgi:hypothetical protein
MEGHIVTFDGVLPSFLYEEFQYMNQASTIFPEEITLYNQMGCMRHYQSRMPPDVYRVDSAEGYSKRTI